MDVSERRTHKFFSPAEVEGLMNEDRIGSLVCALRTEHRWNLHRASAANDPRRMLAILIHPVFIPARFYGL